MGHPVRQDMGRQCSKWQLNKHFTNRLVFPLLHRRSSSSTASRAPDENIKRCRSEPRRRSRSISSGVFLRSEPQQSRRKDGTGLVLPLASLYASDRKLLEGASLYVPWIGCKSNPAVSVFLRFGQKGVEGERLSTSLGLKGKVWSVSLCAERKERIERDADVSQRLGVKRKERSGGIWWESYVPDAQSST